MAPTVLRLTTLASLVSVLGACSLNEVIEERTRVKYESASEQSRPRLDVPPDLASPQGSDRFTIPETVTSERTASGFERSRATAKPSGAAAVLPTPDGVRMERLGNERWVVAEMPPEAVWPLLREFWQESGFIIQTESPETGILETDWAENRAKVPLDIIRRTLGRAFDSLYSTGERDKFRTRIERGRDGTEIYISHRGMVEVYTSTEKDQTVWQPRPSDPELEVEFMRRLMVKLGAPQEIADQAGAGVQQSQPPSRARLFTDGDQPRLQMSESFDRAWRQIGLALDRGGFTVDDRDRSQGLYFVRYIDPEAQARQASSKPGFFGRMFGGRKEETISKQFRLQAAGTGGDTEVKVLDSEGRAVTGIDRTTATRILTLLHEQLNQPGI